MFIKTVWHYVGANFMTGFRCMADFTVLRLLTSFWLRPAGAHSYVVVLKVGSLRDTTGLVTIIRFLLYMRRPPPPLTLAVRWEQGESASRRPIRWSSSRSPPGAWSIVSHPHTVHAFLHRAEGKKKCR